MSASNSVLTNGQICTADNCSTGKQSELSVGHLESILRAVIGPEVALADITLKSARRVSSTSVSASCKCKYRLALPVFNFHGHRAGYQVRAHALRTTRGKSAKDDTGRHADGSGRIPIALCQASESRWCNCSPDDRRVKARSEKRGRMRRRYVLVIANRPERLFLKTRKSPVVAKQPSLF